MQKKYMGFMLFTQWQVGIWETDPLGILTDDSVESEGEVVSDDAAHVRPERVSDAGETVGPQPGPPQRAQRLRRAARRGPQVVDGRHVARRLAQGPPVQHKHVVTAATEVRWWINLRCQNSVSSLHKNYAALLHVGDMDPNFWRE